MSEQLISQRVGLRLAFRRANAPAILSTKFVRLAYYIA